MIASVEGASRGSSGIGPVVIVVGLAVGSALVMWWLIHRLPGSNENTGASPFARWRRSNSFDRPPQDPMDQPPGARSIGDAKKPWQILRSIRASKLVVGQDVKLRPSGHECPASRASQPGGYETGSAKNSSTLSSSSPPASTPTADLTASPSSPPPSSDHETRVE